MYLLVFTLLGVAQVSAFFIPLSFDQKCYDSDLIVHGAVIDIVSVTVPEEKAKKIEGLIVKEPYGGPNSVALVQVKRVVKGGARLLNRVVLVPCGYDFNESPSELTKGKEYVLFLEKMGHGFFHPLDPQCTHRVIKEQVAISGFDHDIPLDPERRDPSHVRMNLFIEQITESLKKSARAKPAIK